MATYVLNDEKMFSDIADGVAIVINSETGIYYGMNMLGTAIFENILEGASTEDITEALQALPNAPENCEELVQKFMAELEDFGIVSQGQTDNAAVNIDITAIEEGFVLSVQEFNDAQELLLADPIHEVKDDTGWQPSKDALETDEDVLAAKHEKIEK